MRGWVGGDGVGSQTVVGFAREVTPPKPAQRTQDHKGGLTANKTEAESGMEVGQRGHRATMR